MSQMNLGNALSDPRQGEPGQSNIVVRRLCLHSSLDSESVAALERLLGRPTTFEAGVLIAEAGDVADMVTVMRDGFACRMSLLPDGRRQIHSVFLAGDTVDAEAPLLPVRPDNIEALRRCSAWLLPKSRLAALQQTCPKLVEAFARDAAIAAQVAREWVVNLGQRTALERIAHLICELHARMTAVGLASDKGFILPMTQLEISDAQGLSSVHVNRVMQELRKTDLIRTERRWISIPNIARLRNLAMFNPIYLYLQAIPA